MMWKSRSMSRPYVETFSGSHHSSMLFALHLEADLGRRSRLHLDLFLHLAERLVPHLDLLLAGGHALELRDAVRVGDRRPAGRHREPAEHPAVHVAGELDDLRLVELLGHRLLE